MFLSKKHIPHLLLCTILSRDFHHQHHSVLKSDLVNSSHFSSGGITHAVKYLVKHMDLFLDQRIFKGDTEFIILVGELGRVNSPHTEVLNHINHCKHTFGNYLACCIGFCFLKLLYAYCRNVPDTTEYQHLGKDN